MPRASEKPAVDSKGEPLGLVCPRCGCQHFLCFYVRRISAGRIRRVKTCRHCGRRVVTVEVMQ